MLMSTPSKPISRTSFATRRKLLRPGSPDLRNEGSLLLDEPEPAHHLPRAPEHSPSVLVNSVMSRSGGPASRTIWRNTVSVTSSMGARTENPLRSSFQIPMEISI